MPPKRRRDEDDASEERSSKLLKDDAGLPLVPIITTTCVTCEESVPLEQTQAIGAGRSRKCNLCKNSEVFVRKKLGPEKWKSMEPGDRKEQIIANKKSAAGKGHKRELTLVEKVTVEDHLAMMTRKPMMNERVFTRHCQDNWGWSLVVCQKKWKEAIR